MGQQFNEEEEEEIMAKTKKVCTPPSLAEKALAKLQGRKAKQKCKRVPVNKEGANTIASSINWGGKHSS